MRRAGRIWAVVVLACVLSGAGAHAGTALLGVEGRIPSLAPVLENVLPGVVSIAVQGRAQQEQNPLFADPFFRKFFGVPEQPQERQFQAAGSGVILDAARGYVVTNNHVIENADKITVVLSDGRRLNATLVGTDPETDIAVIKVPAERLKGLTMGDSDKLKVGDFVIAIGNPFGLQQTVTSGIVSALGRTGLGIEGYESFIQTDASINPGNSGGALVDLRGQLVGINTAIVGPAGGNVGIGFAIPINMAKRVMEQLIAHGKVSRGRLGVTIQDLTPELAAGLKVDVQAGALVAQVEPGSPAAKAGIAAGDVVTAIDGEPVTSSSDLRNKVGMRAVGSQVKLDLIHAGKRKTVVAVLAEGKAERIEIPSEVKRLEGVVLGRIEPGTPYYGKVEGAVVVDIKPGSPAANAGLRKGDVIIAVNQRPVHGPEDVLRIARSRSGGLLLQVMRDGGGLFVMIG